MNCKGSWILGTACGNIDCEPCVSGAMHLAPMYVKTHDKLTLAEADLEKRTSQLLAEQGRVRAADRQIEELTKERDELQNQTEQTQDQSPVPMRLYCPDCGELHVDEGEFKTKVHHTHACQHCGNVWRPAIVPTVGVRFLPRFKESDS